MKRKEKKRKKLEKRVKKERKGTFGGFCRRWLPFLFGVVLESAAVAIFLDPSGLTPGGFSGLSIALNRFLPLGTGLWMLLLNVPIVILGIIVFGFKFFSGTIVAIIGTSGLVTLFETYLQPITGEPSPMVGAIAGGALVGVAVGLVFRAGASFGGTDVIVKLLRLKFKYIKTGSFYLIVDGLIVLFGGIAFWEGSLDNIVYAVIAIFVQSYVSDLVLYGSEGARMLFIITNSEEEISRRVNDELHSGVTYLRGTGAYTGKEKRLLLCVMRKQLVPKAKEIVLAEDPDAFMIVTAASQVLGKGYKPLDEEEL